MRKILNLFGCGKEEEGQPTKFEKKIEKLMGKGKTEKAKKLMEKRIAKATKNLTKATDQRDANDELAEIIMSGVKIEKKIAEGLLEKYIDEKVYNKDKAKNIVNEFKVNKKSEQVTV